ncbi:MAG: cupin [Actinomycetota bacterium]|nr:MAG: cupin [Actinomycetota bacterium]
MSTIDSRSFDKPDETRRPAKSSIDIVRLGDNEVGRFTFEPGWRWSECIKPIVGGEACQVEHVGYVASGRLHVVHDDGSTAQLSAGDAYRISPGHDAWVEGDQPFVGYEFKGAATYAKA